MGRPSSLKALGFSVGAAVLTVVLAALALVPALAFFILLVLLPAPLLTAWVYLSQGPRWAYVSAAVAVLAAVLIAGPAAALVAAICFVCVLGGLALGAAAANHSRPLLAGVMVTVAMLGGTLVLLALWRAVLGIDVVASLRQAATDAGTSWTPALILSADQRQAFQRQIADLLVYFFPFSLVTFFSGCTVLIYILARWTLGRRYEVQPMQPFAEWRFPRWMPWLFVPGLLLWLVGLRPAMEGAVRLGKNYLQVMNVLFEIQGLAVVYWWLRKRLGRVIAGVLAAALSLISPPLVGMLLMFLGLWDALFDFRKLEPRPQR